MEMTLAFDACAFLLCGFCLFYRLHKRGARTRQNIVFLLMLGNIMASAFCAIIANVIQASDRLRVPENIPLLTVSLWFYFLIHTTLSAVYALYIRIVIGLDLTSSRRRELLFLIPAVIGVVIVWLNIPLQWVFHINEQIRFERGSMEILLYACSIFYIVQAFYLFVRYHFALQQKTMRLLVICYSVTIVGVVLQVFIPQMKVELFFESIGVLGLMLTFEEDDAYHDSVTSLYNRMAFRQDVRRLLATNQSFFCVNVNFLNLGFYARIMGVDTFHALLRSIASRIRTLYARMNVYHFDDNYTMLLFDPPEEEVKTLLRDMEAMLDRPWTGEGVEAQLQSFISVVKAPDDVSELDDVLDLLEYEPDNKGAHVTVQYRESLTYVKREAAVERALRNAVMNRAFQVYYQPIYNCDTGTITCAEALVRLFDEELGQVSPGEFIPIAEKSALIVEIGNIVFEKVCRFLKENRPERYGIEYTEVNLSVAQFMQSNLVQTFADTLRAYDIKASRINLEITESVASESTEPFMLAVRQLENLGFTFSMDDYGTGYSNIASILNVNFKNIKMDKSFLAKALDSREGATILRDTTHLIRHLGRNVLQEGVETREELNFVQDAGCNLVQGYYFSRPLPEQDFLSYVKSFNADHILRIAQ